MATDALSQGLLLLRQAKLKELLDDIVAKHIRHEAVRSSQDLAEDHLALGGSGTLQFLLDEARPMLVLMCGEDTDAKKRQLTSHMIQILFVL